MRPVLEMIVARRPVRRQRADHRRERHRQGRGGADAARAFRSRSTRPLVTVNTGGLAEGVFESELFGHVKGAFTDAKTDRVGRFELADGGTLFLDEIANISADHAGQAAARARDRRVRARGLFQDAARGRAHHLRHQRRPAMPRWPAGRFRQDLLFRLNTIEIHLPPLRDRREDIPLLAAHFLRAARAALPQAHHRLRRSAPSRRCWPTPGRATCANWTTPWSARVLMAQGELIRPADLGLRRGARRRRRGWRT